MDQFTDGKWENNFSSSDKAFKIIIVAYEWIHLQQQFKSNGISDKCCALLGFDY